MKRNIFQKLFPPPRFLRMPAAGLDISDESIRFAELVEGGEGKQISKFGEYDIPKGVVEDGEIKKKEDLKEVLSRIKRENDLDFINVGLPEQQAYLLKLNLPKGIRKSEIRGNIELQLEDNVPISAGDAVFDYDIAKDSNPRDDFLEIGLSVVPRSIVDSYTEAIEGTGLTPLSFEIEAQSIARSVVKSKDRGTFMVVDFGKTRTGVSIVSGDIVRFTSTISVGGAAITQAIAKSFSVDMKEAEKLKQERGFTNSRDNQELFLAIISTIAVLKDEIQKHYVYWHSHKDRYGNQRPKVEKIILCGGDSNANGFPEYLGTSLGVSVELANTMVNIGSLEEYIPEIPFKDSLRYATAIGLALKERP